MCPADKNKKIQGPLLVISEIHLSISKNGESIPYRGKRRGSRHYQVHLFVFHSVLHVVAVVCNSVLFSRAEEFPHKTRLYLLSSMERCTCCFRQWCPGNPLLLAFSPRWNGLNRDGLRLDICPVEDARRSQVAFPIFNCTSPLLRWLPAHGFSDLADSREHSRRASCHSPTSV